RRRGARFAARRRPGARLAATRCRNRAAHRLHGAVVHVCGDGGGPVALVHVQAAPLARKVMSAAVGNVRSHGATSARNKRLLVLLAAIALSYLAYYAWPRDARVNYGELLAPQTIAPIAGTRADGVPFDLASLRGRWVVLYAAPGNCSGNCADALYASRQARTIQNAERGRVVR